jgi:predicted transcriptional regulator
MLCSRDHGVNIDTACHEIVRMAEPSAIPDAALEDIAYLSRSENRVRILETLTADTHSRRELADVTGTSRTTLGRILSELEDRNWTTRTTDGEYVATPRGEHAAVEFLPLVASMQTLRELGEAAGWIPIEELSIDLRHFRDATVRRTVPNEPVEPGRYLAPLIRDASTLSTLTFVAPPRVVGRAMENGVSSDQLTAEHVLAGGLIEHLRDHPDGPPQWHDYITAGARVYYYDGHIPCNLFVVDDTVLLLNDRPNAGEAIETENETVRSWAHDLIATYREAAETVEADTFS